MRRMRERRAAGLLPAGGVPPRRPVEERLRPAVEETLAALGLEGDGLAAGQIARRYATVIDEASDPAWALRWIGPHLLQALTELKATPMSAKAAVAAKWQPDGLDRLRTVRAGNNRRKVP
jgi:hypothetical protein